MSETTLYHRRIHEDPLDGRRLGRHVLHDARSRKFPAKTAAVIKDVAHKAVGLPLDQGARGACTGFALTAARNSLPDYKGGAPATNADANVLYDREIVLEGGNPATDDPGGSGLMVCRAAKKLGLIKSYRHAFGLEHALKALVLRAQIWGVDWYDGFDRLDSEGIVRISGSVRGGHEICALKIIEARALVGFAQSWGQWGVADADLGMTTGVFYVPFEDLDRLLQQQGDVTVPYV